MAIQVVHGGKFIKTEGKKEMHDVPENLEMYFSRSKINFKVNLAAIIANVIDNMSYKHLILGTLEGNLLVAIIFCYSRFKQDANRLLPSKL